MQDAVALCCADDLLRQQLSVRFVGQRIQAEHQPSFAFMAQRHVPRRLIQIRLETAVADAGLFREQIGEHIDVYKRQVPTGRESGADRTRRQGLRER